MRRALLMFAVLSVGLPGCRAAAPAEAPSSAKVEGRATAMPESLKCRSASDCAPEATCYWGEPSCVATASAAAPIKCGDDADPPRPEIGCECTDGQCTAVERK